MMRLSEIGVRLFLNSASSLFRRVSSELKEGTASYLNPTWVYEIEEWCFELRVARLLYEQDLKSGNSFVWAGGLKSFFAQLKNEAQKSETSQIQPRESVELRLRQMLQGLFNGTYAEVELAQQLRRSAICNFNPRLEVDEKNVILPNRYNLEELYFELLPWSLSNSFGDLAASDLSEAECLLMTDIVILLEAICSDVSENNESLASAVMRGAERTRSLLEVREAEG